MRFIADLHIHSRFSRATSRDLGLEHLDLWARRKGVAVVGTGDFTHPGWFSELKERLEPSEPGLFRLKKDYRIDDDPWVPESSPAVRFMLSVEISNIYKKGGRVRKVHNLILAPDFETAEKIGHALERIGNIRSDGRPILGLDSKDLLEIVLESSDEAVFIPAHIWTPWFSMLGSKSGFDSVEECFDELTSHIFALETGLSSDPPMNWRLSGLDDFALVSNSDAHSPKNLAREANVFDTEMSFFDMREALESRDPERYLGTIEFFPQEGKYHYDGHRKCNTCMCPKDTRTRKGLCPVCGRPVTVGVMHRVEELADRDAGYRPSGALPYRSLIPLPEIISELMQVGKASKRVQEEYFRLLKRLGPEVEILEMMPVEMIEKGSEILAEAVRRMREGKVIIREGYDGEYGVITLFEPEELKGLGRQKALFQAVGAPAARKKERAEKRPEAAHADSRVQEGAAQLAGPLFSPDTAAVRSSPVIFDLNPDQERVVKDGKGPIMIVAGPGTGKTRTLTHRIANLVNENMVSPEKTLAVTFTNKARDEMRERLLRLIPDPEILKAIFIKTFHALGLLIIREDADALGMDRDFTILSEDQITALLKEILNSYLYTRNTRKA
jgi:DNA helicase-2/ATP-dependent DNA helicase PcrA